MSQSEYKQVIVLRKDLNMRKGKMVAQGAHASLGVFLKNGHFEGAKEEGGRLVIELTPGMRGWLEDKFTKITVSVNSEKELLALHQKAQAAGLPTVLIQDAGLTEFGGIPTYTAVVIGPDHRDRVDSITRGLPLL